MQEGYSKEVRLFYCYAHEDQALLNELEKRLIGLKHSYPLTTWYDTKTIPGEEWAQTASEHLDTSHIILLLISPAFLASNHCHNEMQRALERRKSKSCRVIPVLLRPTNWNGTLFSKLQMLPSNTKPITSWSKRDEAFKDVIEGIIRAIENVDQLASTKDEWFFEGKSLFDSQQFEKALNAFDQVLNLSPNYVPAHAFKATVLSFLQRYAEANAIFSWVASPDSGAANIQGNKRKELEVQQAREIDNRKLIAIVEDDPELAELFRDAFKAFPHWQLDFFNDGYVASQHMPMLQPDLILLDIGLPSLDGPALYKILRGHNSTRHTPIIVITSSHDWQLHRMGLQTGLFLRKPFKLRELLFIMRAHLGENSAAASTSEKSEN